MNFDSKFNLEKIGKKVGFMVMFFLFSIILYFILIFNNKLPKNWNFIHIISIVFLIVLIGSLIKWRLK